MSKEIRPATEEDLNWLRGDYDQDELELQAERGIEEASSATPTPRHWRPVEIGEAA